MHRDVLPEAKTVNFMPRGLLFIGIQRPSSVEIMTATITASARDAGAGKALPTRL